MSGQRQPSKLAVEKSTLLLDLGKVWKPTSHAMCHTSHHILYVPHIISHTVCATHHITYMCHKVKEIMDMIITPLGASILYYVSTTGLC